MLAITAKINLLAVAKRKLARPPSFIGNGADHTLRKLHALFPVSVRPVPFHSYVFRQVFFAVVFVPKARTNIKHLFIASNEQAF